MGRCILKNHNFVFIFDAHLPYIRNEIADGGVEEDWLFDTLSYSLLPMLKMCEKLKKSSKFKAGIVFEPVLCEMLADKILQDRYRDYLDRKIKFAKKELKNFSDSREKKRLVQYTLMLLTENKRTFEDCGGEVLKHFDSLAKQGFIEILATTASSCCLPFFEEIPEAIYAQIEMGQISYRRHFSCTPRGFWLPGLAYKNGLDKIIRSYGYEYTIVESKAFLLADKMPPTGVFAPAVSRCGLKFLATDACAECSVTNEDCAYLKNKIYLNSENDVGFNYSEESLSSVFDTSKGRRAIGFKYWSREEEQTLYNIDLALEQAKKDAKDFVEKRKSVLNSVQEKTNYDSATSLIICSSDLLGKKWAEGFTWLEEVFRLISSDPEIRAIHPIRAANISEQLYTVSPFFSSVLDSGYAAELLNTDSDWMYCFVLKTTRKMIELVEMFPMGDSLIERILNAAAREVLLLQAHYWPLYASSNDFKEFAEQRFIDHIQAFSQAYEALGADAPDTRWLTEREAKFPIFEDMNYRIFSRKE